MVLMLSLEIERGSVECLIIRNVRRGMNMDYKELAITINCLWAQEIGGDALKKILDELMEFVED